MQYVFKYFCAVILLASISCEEGSPDEECGAYGSEFRFTVVDKATGQDLFFDSDSPYTEGELRLYQITIPRSQNPSDTLFRLSLRTLERDGRTVFTTFLPAHPSEDEVVFARIGGTDIDTLSITSRSEGFYDNGECERIVADEVYYNGELVCSECSDSVSYVIRK